jgi:hypothetical protein
MQEKSFLTKRFLNWGKKKNPRERAIKSRNINVTCPPGTCPGWGVRWGPWACMGKHNVIISAFFLLFWVAIGPDWLYLAINSPFFFLYY